MGNFHLCQGTYLSPGLRSRALTPRKVSAATQTVLPLSPRSATRGQQALYFSSLRDNLQPNSLSKILFISTKALQRKSVSKKNDTELNLPSTITPGIWERSVPSGFSTSPHQLGLQRSPGPSPGLLNPFLLSSKTPGWVKRDSLKRKRSKTVQHKLHEPLPAEKEPRHS